MSTADLHIHTTASDGKLTPEEVISQAKQAGLKWIAVTDHDTVAGLFDLERKSLLDDDLNIIHGIEFSTDLSVSEVHILGYFIDINSPQLHKQLNILLQYRKERIIIMLKKLAKLGYELSLDDVYSVAGTSAAVGRPHIARALVYKGYFLQVADAFNKLLYKNGPAYEPHYKLSPEQAINLIQEVGGVAVLAHPGLVQDDRIVLDLIDIGLEGLEVYHPVHDDNTTKKYLNLAEKSRLLITGGSDYHGIVSRYPEKLGMFTIPSDLAEKLAAYAQRRKNIR